MAGTGTLQHKGRTAAREEAVPPLVCTYFSEPAKLEASLHLELGVTFKRQFRPFSWDPAPHRL